MPLQTLGQSFAKQQQNAALESQLVFEESLPKAPQLVETVFQGLEADYLQYSSKFCSLNDDEQPMVAPPRAERRSARLKASAVKLEEGEEDEAPNDSDIARREQNGCQFVSQLAHLASEHTVLPRKQQQNLFTVTLNSDLHRDAQLSVRALQLLHHTLRHCPPAVLDTRQGYSVVAKNDENLEWLSPSTALTLTNTKQEGRPKSQKRGALQVMC